MQVTITSQQPDVSSMSGSVYKGADFSGLGDQQNVILTPPTANLSEWDYARVRSLALDDHLLVFQNSMIRSITGLKSIYIILPQSFINAMLTDPEYVPISTLRITK